MARRQHCPEGATHTKGPTQSAMDMRAMPPTPAAPTSPSPPRIGAMPAVPSPAAPTPAAPTPAAAAAPPTRLLAIPVEARRAKPPEQRVNYLVIKKTEMLEFRYYKYLNAKTFN